MAILKIARMGHPILLKSAQPVADPTTPEVQRLVFDMIETLADAGGTGLAAPQVHIPSRVVIYSIDADSQGHEGNPKENPNGTNHPESGQPLTVVINPKIEPLTSDIEHAWEACLSVPGLAGRVPRHTGIRISYLTPEGEQVAREVYGFHARVLQHECDHLDGILYPMRMNDLSEFGFVEDLNKLAQMNQSSGTSND